MMIETRNEERGNGKWRGEEKERKKKESLPIFHFLYFFIENIKTQIRLDILFRNCGSPKKGFWGDVDDVIFFFVFQFTWS